MANNLPDTSWFNRISAKLVASRFLTISLVIHVVLVLGLGGVVLFEATRDQEGFDAPNGPAGILSEESEAGVEGDQPLEFEQPETTLSEVSNTVVSPSSAVSALTDVSTSWSTTVSNGDQLIGTSFGPSSRAPMGNMQLGGGRGGSSGGGGKMSGTLFGLKVDTSKLGVILDISMSAHPFLAAPMKEVTKNFSQCDIVLYGGCGMKENTHAQNYAIDTAERSAERAAQVPEIRHRGLHQLHNMRRNNKELNDCMLDLLQQSRIYVAMNTVEGAPHDQVTGGCHFVFAKLIEDGVDTIYWFSDFGDKRDPDVFEKLVKEMRRKRVKLILHNFTGKGVGTDLQDAVKATKGDIIKTGDTAKK